MPTDHRANDISNLLLQPPRERQSINSWRYPGPGPLRRGAKGPNPVRKFWPSKARYIPLTGTPVPGFGGLYGLTRHAPRCMIGAGNGALRKNVVQDASNTRLRMMDLDLEVRTVGRPAKPLEGEIVRQLNSADLALLEIERGVKAPSLKKLRDSHHAIAKCIAQGLPNTEISLITGYSQSRISILKADPAFQELVAFYKGKVDAAYDEATTDAASKIAAVRNDAIEEIQDRLNDAPETFAPADLLDVVKVFADRSGFGPASKSTNVHLHLDVAERIAAGRRRAAQLGAPQTSQILAAPPTIEGSAVSLPSSGKSEP